MSPEEYITNLILSFGEVETLELLHIINISNDPPPFRKGEFSPLEVQAWVGRNRDAIVPSILRVVDLGDEAIAYLTRLVFLPVKWKTREAIRISFSEISDPSQDLRSFEEVLDIPDE